MARTKGKGGKYSAQNAGGKEKLNRGEAKKENDIKLDRNPKPNTESKVTTTNMDSKVTTAMLAGTLNQALVKHFLCADGLNSIQQSVLTICAQTTSGPLHDKLSGILRIVDNAQAILGELGSELSDAQKTAASTV